ncbi:threonine/serine exporter ThrE family protein [Escherichia coli]
MGKLIPFLFIALDGKSAVAHLRLRIPGHKLRGSWLPFTTQSIHILRPLTPSCILALISSMHVVTEVQHIVILAEHHLLDYKGVEKRFSQIQPLRYPRWLVALMVGLSCACFCKLNKGGWDGAVITFFASTAAMYIRQLLAQRHLHPQINFCLTAFAATTISGLLLQLPTFSNTPTIAMAASVLLLVPGFPLINAVADMFKGHINTGLARWAIASLLTLATCVGVVMALTIWGLRGWV